MMHSLVLKDRAMKQKSADSLANDLEDQQFTEPTEGMSVANKTVTEHKVISDQNGAIELDIIVEDGETMEFEEIIEHEEIIQQPEEESIENEHLEHNQIAQKAEVSLAELNIKRITCLEELQAFDNELKDPELQQKVQKWIDSAVVNREPDVKKRLITLLDRMPYVLVETKTATGSKKLVAAPATWIVRRKATLYLCWPTFVQSASILNAMINDETIIPSADWESRECKYICQNVHSYAAAQDLVEKMNLHSKQIKTSAAATAPMRNKVPNEVPIKDMLMGVEKTLQQEIIPELFNGISPKREEDPLGLSQASAEVETVAHEQQSENRKKLYSTINANPQDNDPLEDVKPFPRLEDLIHELKCMIISNQEEIRKKLNEGFYRMQKTMLSMVGNRSPEELVTTQEEPNLAATECNDMSSLGNLEVESDFPDNPDAFGISAFTRREELDAFEDRLNDEEYRRRVYSWINDIVPYEANPETRMMDLLDLLMDRKFFTKFSWKSNTRYRKIPLSEYVNFCQLFQHVGTTQVHRADAAFVEYFFKKKMKHALNRIHLRGLRRCVPKSVRRQRNLEKGSASVQRQRKGVGMEVEQDTGTCLPERNQPSPTITEIVVVDVNPITCEEGMIEFDTQLENDEYLKEVHKWTNTTVGHMSDPEQRMREILERLVDRSFLQSFNWTKEAMVRYRNFVRYLEYVGTTAQHQVSHTFVAIFLRKKLHRRSAVAVGSEA
uniref:DUF4806 domain-containing protein n=1 Tax=Anopheles maculatus TaxID=74869 RepID=A0A182SBA3_9DIPT